MGNCYCPLAHVEWCSAISTTYGSSRPSEGSRPWRWPRSCVRCSRPDSERSCGSRPVSKALAIRCLSCSRVRAWRSCIAWRSRSCITFKCPRASACRRSASSRPRSLPRRALTIGPGLSAQAVDNLGKPFLPLAFQNGRKYLPLLALPVEFDKLLRRASIYRWCLPARSLASSPAGCSAGPHAHGILQGSVHDRTVFAAALTGGSTALDDEPNGPAAWEINHMVKQVVGAFA